MPSYFDVSNYICFRAVVVWSTCLCVKVRYVSELRLKDLCFQALAAGRASLERQLTVYEEIDQSQEETESWLDDIVQRMETSLAESPRDPVLLQATLNKYNVSKAFKACYILCRVNCRHLLLRLNFGQNQNFWF